MGLILADVDAAIALVQSKLGAAFLANSARLRLTNGVYGELTGPRQTPGAETKKAACVAEACLKRNDEFSEPQTTDLNDIELGDVAEVSSFIDREFPDTEFGIGELSIVQYIREYDNDEVEFEVVYHDSDVEKLTRDPQFNKSADLIQATAPLNRMKVNKDRKVEAVLKTIAGREWNSDNEFRALFVRSGILTRAEFNDNNGNYGLPQLKMLLSDVEPDVAELYRSLCQ